MNLDVVTAEVDRLIGEVRRLTDERDRLADELARSAAELAQRNADVVRLTGDVESLHGLVESVSAERDLADREVVDLLTDALPVVHRNGVTPHALARLTRTVRTVLVAGSTRSRIREELATRGGVA